MAGESYNRAYGVSIQALQSNRALLYNHSLTAMAGESYNREYGMSIQS